MKLAAVLFTSLCAASLAVWAQGESGRNRSASRVSSISVVEATIPQLQAALTEGRLTSHDLVVQYLTRIALYEDKLNAIISVNPKAIGEADARDLERAQGRVRGPLHGIPIALKDNIQTTDMPTTGGTLAFEGFLPSYEATLTTRLREAGAIIIAKTGMTELANWVAGPPTPMPTNYNALTGFGMNPYDPRRDPREGRSDGRPALATGGSSSGIGTAASFWSANVGTETSGSILSPATQNMLAAIKPTVGRISRHGIIPITADQDTAGPMARTVTDAAILLGVLEGESPDANDAATRRCARPPGGDYTRFLRPDGLKGARIGIPRAFYYDPVPLPGRPPGGGLERAARQTMTDAIAVLTREGATIVDPADIPSVRATDAASNLVLWEVCSGARGAKGSDQECSTVFKYGMKRDFNRWLATLGSGAPVKSLTELRIFNLAHRDAGALKYGQSQLDNADDMHLVTDQARYEADRAKDLRLAATRGIDAALMEHDLDALLFPAAAGASIAAKPGYPTVIVPFGFVPNDSPPPFPPGFDARPMPFGVSFTAGACAEPRLIELAFSFEQATKRRVPPAAVP
jgi:amidase